MRRHDQKRLGQLVSDFVERCGFAPPFYSLTIGANGSVAVAKHSDSDVQQVCSFMRGPGVTAPVTVAVISADGRASAAKIKIRRDGAGADAVK